MAKLDNPLSRSTSISSAPIPLMLRLTALTSTPILLDPSTTHASLLHQIQTEIHARSPEIAQGYAFDGLYIEWDRSSGTGLTFPPSSVVDRGNLAATLALLRCREGRDVLCLRVRVAGPEVSLVVG